MDENKQGKLLEYITMSATDKIVDLDYKTDLSEKELNLKKTFELMEEIERKKPHIIHGLTNDENEKTLAGILVMKVFITIVDVYRDLKEKSSNLTESEETIVNKIQFVEDDLEGLYPKYKTALDQFEKTGNEFFSTMRKFI